jgi:hypothetical protein
MRKNRRGIKHVQVKINLRRNIMSEEIKHYITRYSADGKHYVTSWLQAGEECFSVLTVEVE